jgi:hypothetical protein
MGKILKFERPAPPPETESQTLLEAEAAIKQVSKLFTPEELAEIREDLLKVEAEERKPK